MRLDSLRQDLAFAFRSYRRQPGIALTVLATLTLGIGACTAIFSVLNAVLLAPLPYPDKDRLVVVGTNTGASAPKLGAWREQSDIFAEMAAYRGGVVNVTASESVMPGLAVQFPIFNRTRASSRCLAQTSSWAARSAARRIGLMADA